MQLLQSLRHKLNFNAALHQSPRTSMIQPRTLTIETSFACNLRCRMCPRTQDNFLSAGGVQSAFMQPEVFARILPCARQFQHVHLTAWGEPLANPQLLDYARQLKAAGCEVSLTTNGTLLQPKITDRLLELGLEIISVSCDASTAETYEFIRGKGQFGRLQRNLQYLCAARKAYPRPPRVRWIFVMMKSNLDELPEAARIAGQLGVDAFVAKHLETALSPQMLDEALFYTRRSSALSAGEQNYYHSMIEQLRAIGRDYPRMELEIHQQLDKQERSCLARPLELAVVDHEGNLSPCCYTLPMDTRPYQRERSEQEKQLVIGNVLETPLRDLLRAPRYQEFLETFRCGAIPQECEGCLQMSRRLRWPDVQFMGC